MAIFKCKMCGGSLEIDSVQSVATCEYCGTRQTLPRLDDERRANLYDRANHFRRNNDFDKAMGIYENILNEDNTDSEAYWSIVLCRYGIEYVEDPISHRRIPTVNRTQFTSIFDDEDYKSAIDNADGYRREIYEAEAATINEIQKDILTISQKEEPFDVFICYKETDEKGRRTQDSVLATELYYELTHEGFKVFFSRITLEDKLGVAYEPYIFAALQSAKVMVVLGTRPEHFNAVWVKNEWSRYLALIKNGAKKTLIPAYRDIDPYDLPDEFSHLQAQDMSKLGFMQDLTRGIKKIVVVEAPKATVKETIVAPANTPNIAPLLKRAFLFLEDGEFDRADDFFEQVLNQDPENAQAYLGKLMSELQVKRKEELANCDEPFDDSNNYRKIMRFSDSELKAEIEGYIEYIKTRDMEELLENQYLSYVNSINSAKTEWDYTCISHYFEAMGDYKESVRLSKECLDKAENLKKQKLYNVACIVLNDNQTYQSKKLFIEKIEDSINMFESLNGYQDSNEKILLCKRKLEDVKIQAEQERIENERKEEIRKIKAQKRARKAKKIAIILAIILAVAIALVILCKMVIIPNNKYNKAIALMNNGNYDEAIIAFENLDGYRNSNEKIQECNNAIIDNKYNDAITLMNNGQYNEAIIAFVRLDGYKDSNEKISECNNAMLDIKYNDAISLINDGEYDKAIIILKGLDGYKDSAEKIEEAQNAIYERRYQYGLKLYDKAEYEQAIIEFTNIIEYKDALQWIDKCETQIKEFFYENAIFLYQNENYKNAINIFKDLGDFKDSKDYFSKCKDGLSKKSQEMINKSQYSEFVYYALDIINNDYLEKITFTNAQKKGLFDYLTQEVIIDDLSSLNREVYFYEKYFDLISDYQDVRNVRTLCKIYKELKNNDYITLFKNNIEKISSLWDTEIIRKLLTSDRYIAYYMNGRWGAKIGYSEYYLNFYHKNGTNTNTTWCDWNISYPNIDHEYWDIQNLEFVFLDKDHNVVAKVYKIEFINANKIKVYSYDDSESYTLIRDFYTEGLNFGTQYNSYNEDDTYKVSDYNGTSKEVIVPLSYQGIKVTAIDDSAFYLCTTMTEIQLPNSITKIGKNAFNGCSSLKKIKLPDSVTSIGQGAFSSCSSLQTVYIGKNTTSISSGAFSGCSKLSTIMYSGTIAQWNSIDKGDSWDFNTGNYIVCCSNGTINK